MKGGPAHATLTAAVGAAATPKPVGIEARGVRVVLGGTPILRGIDLTVDAGEWVSIVGPNGAGKSTLLAALAGLRRSEGDVAVGGTALRSLTARERARHIGFVPQLPVVPPRMSVASYVMLGRTPHLPLLGIEGSLDLAVVEKTIDLLDLRGLAERMIDSLSGGELRRCQLARVLAQETPVLLLDEPTAALDLGHQQQALDLLDRLRRERGLTVVTTMHDLTLAGHYSDRMVLLAHGEVKGSGRAEDVLYPALLEQVYGVALRVVRLDARLVVLPGVTLPPASCGGEYRHEALTTARTEEAR